MDERLHQIERHWTERAGVFDEEPDHGLRDPGTALAWKGLLNDLVPPGAVDILDLGCGTGSLSVVLARPDRRVVGVDLAATMVEAARLKAVSAGVDVRLVVGDASAPPVAPGMWDVVLVRHVAWTLLEPEATIRHWFGLLRPEGRLVLIEGRWTADGTAAGIPLPWGGGVTAEALRAVLERTGEVVEYRSLSADAALWGRSVNDERYAIVASRTRQRSPKR